eukprot:scaffold276_cov132-Cylindrotheca_fusiformis.AAC.6
MNQISLSSYYLLVLISLLRQDVEVSAFTMLKSHLKQESFRPPHRYQKRRSFHGISSSSISTLLEGNGKNGEVATSSADDLKSEAERIKLEAERIREEAARMEVHLLLGRVQKNLDKLDKLKKKPISDEDGQTLMEEVRRWMDRVDLILYENPEQEKPAAVDTIDVHINTTWQSSSESAATNGETEEEEIQLFLRDSIDQYAASVNSTGRPKTEEEEMMLSSLEDIVRVMEENNEAETSNATEKPNLPLIVLDYLFGIGNPSYDLSRVDNTSMIDLGIISRNESEFVGSLSVREQERIRSLKNRFHEILVAIEEDRFLGNASTAFGESVRQSYEAALAGNITRKQLNLLQVSEILASLLPYHVWDFQPIEKGSKAPFVNERKSLMAKSFNPILFSPTKNNLDESVAMGFCEDIIDSNSTNVFARKAQPTKIGSAFLIEGTPLVEDGKELVSQLQEALQVSPYADKMHLFYIRDPSGIIDFDDVETADFLQNNLEDEEDVGEIVVLLNRIEPPALLITGKNVKSLAPWKRNAVFSLISFVSLVTFSGSCYVPNGDLLQTFFAGIQSPIVAYVLATIALQHAIQLLFAMKGGFSISPFPVVYPGIGGLPISFTSVTTDSPVKDNNDFFDFAFVGPMVAFLLSYGMVVVGLENTVQLPTAAEIAQLPRIDLEFLQQSFLTSATIESVVGTDMLLSIGDGTSSIVPLSPLAIAGHIGMFIYALQMLPSNVANDGGRMANAVFGKFSLQDGLATSFASLFLLVQAFRGGTNTLYLAWVLLFPQLFLSVNLPCLNDVDLASRTRLGLFGVSVLLAVLALSPAT